MKRDRERQSALQCVAECCGVLLLNGTQERSATHYNTLQRTATHCNAQQRTATHCNALQRTATQGNTRNMLQHTATQSFDMRSLLGCRVSADASHMYAKKNKEREIFVRMCELEQKKIIHFRLCATICFENKIMSSVYVCVVCMYEWAMWHASNYGTDTLLTSHMAWMRQVTHEWVMPHMNESCVVWISHVACEWFMLHMNESYHMWMRHVTHEWVMSRMDDSCHEWISHGTHDWVMSHICESCQTWTSYVTHDWSRMIYEQVISPVHKSCLIQMSHAKHRWVISHMNGSCHT